MKSFGWAITGLFACASLLVMMTGDHLGALIPFGLSFVASPRFYDKITEKETDTSKPYISYRAHLLIASVIWLIAFFFIMPDAPTQ